MDFSMSPRAAELHERLVAFMDAHIYPNEQRFREEIVASGDPHHEPPVLRELQEEARRQSLWNLFLPNREYGAGLSNTEYAPLAEVMGRSIDIAPHVFNCAAPDTGNMEILAEFGTPDQKERWLKPLLAGEIRSAFCMTEPDVASSDANNIEGSIVRDGDEYAVNGRKWWSTGAGRASCRLLIFMGKTDAGLPRHRQHSMVLVPADAPGVRIVRSLPVFGYEEAVGHAEIEFRDVRVPAGNLLGDEGSAFAIAQARLGPGRIHHCMRAIGQAERAFDLMCQRALRRAPFGLPLAEQGVVQNWIAESRVDLEAARLLVMKTAWLMDTVGNREAAVEISAIKVLVPNVVERVFDRAIQTYGGAGVSDDFPLAYGWAYNRTLRLVDGPDEVHKAAIARRELKRYRAD
jgi:acyl-CoA dehydrogenase